MTRCPSWCAESYRCTSPAGEHRSEPIVASRSGISLVVSLTQRADRGRPTVEIRLSVRLTSRTDTGQRREMWHLLRRLGTLTRTETNR